MSYAVNEYVFKPPGPSFDLTKHEKAIWPKIWLTTAKLDDYPAQHEVLGLEFYINHYLHEGHGTHWNAKYYNLATGRLLFESDFDIPNPSTGGWTYWTWYRIYSWIGHTALEINEPMEIQVNVNITSNILPPVSYMLNFTVTTELPEPEACPDFWVDPIGAVVCWITNAFQMVWGFTLGAIRDAILWIHAFQLNITTEILKFLLNPIGYIQDVINGFIKAIEGEQATVNVDLRESEEGHWVSGTEWIAGQYKTVDDLTDAEFQALVNKGLTDDKDALRAADFRLYKLDASSKATFEATMNTLRSTVGGLWLAIDTNTELLVGWDSEQFAYVVNYVEELNTSWIDRVWDVVEGAVSFMAGGFLDFDSWLAVTVLDWEGYTDSKIVDVHEWFDIEIPNVVEAMFDWAKPIVKPIQDAVGFLGSIVDVITGKYEQTEEYKEAQQKIQEENDEIQEIIDGLE